MTCQRGSAAVNRIRDSLTEDLPSPMFNCTTAFFPEVGASISLAISAWTWRTRRLLSNSTSNQSGWDIPSQPTLPGLLSSRSISARYSRFVNREILIVRWNIVIFSAYSTSSAFHGSLKSDLCDSVSLLRTSLGDTRGQSPALESMDSFSVKAPKDLTIRSCTSWSVVEVRRYSSSILTDEVLGISLRFVFAMWLFSSRERYCCCKGVSSILSKQLSKSSSSNVGVQGAGLERSIGHVTNTSGASS